MPRTKEEREIDLVIGRRVHLRRRLLGISQSELSEPLGFTFQQLQKCEKAINAISASRLYRLAVGLNAPIDYFYEDLPPTTKTPHGIFDASESLTVQEALSRQGLKLMQAFARVRNPKTRRMIAELVVQAADSEAGGEPD
jgi:transcriptional regulator with XRE-family HTH domain